jgi:hypothetical protein
VLTGPSKDHGQSSAARVDNKLNKKPSFLTDKPPCHGVVSTKFRCAAFSKSDIANIQMKLLEMEDKNLKKAWVTSLMEKRVGAKQVYYNLPKGDETLRVCNKLFSRAVMLTRRALQNWFKNKSKANYDEEPASAL